MTRAASLILALSAVASAQIDSGPADAAALGWRKIAGTVIDEGLASPSSGQVRAVWYAGGAERLLALTASGRVFETTDFARWRLNTTDSLPAAPKMQSAGTRLYSLESSNLLASDDAGRTWANLTGFNNRSVIGGGFSGLAVSPANPQEISVANASGVWRSLDGGLSWSGLNEDLPNLLVRKLVDRRTAVLADGTLVEDRTGTWTQVAGSDPEAALGSRFSQAIRAGVSAAAQAGATAYAGTTDGRLLVSLDSGATWNEAPQIAGASRATGPIAKIWLDNERPTVALAAAGAQLLRTVNGGLFWDDVTGALPRTEIHGIAADRSAGVVYLATDRGVLEGNVPLNDAGPGAAGWTSVSRDLPAATAWDVRLNLDNTLTVALDGYGVFEAAAPHRARSVRIVNGADMSDRAAAPGSLISVLNASVVTARPAEINGGTVSWPVVASSSQSSQLQVPFEATPGGIFLSLQGAGEQWTVPLTVKNAAPAIFVDAEGAPLILDASSGLVLDPKIAVHAGSAVQVLATGLGKVTPDWPTGVPAPLDSPPAVSAPVTAFLDGSPLTVTGATLAPGYVGYYVVELQIPPIVNRGVGELRIVMNGEESNRVKLYLESDLALR
jgi:uncharacterized protein (TIGR03437 family)